MDKEGLQTLIDTLSHYSIFIIVVIVLMVASLIIVKRWLNGNKTPAFFKSAFGIGRDYEAELQAIVNQYPQYTAYTEWVYADINLSDWEPGLTGIEKNIHKSYIIIFGNNQLVVIPILVKDDTIVSYEPLVIRKENITSLKYSNLSKVTTIEVSGSSQKIKYQVLGQFFKSVTFTDVFSTYNEESGEIVQPEDATNKSQLVSKVNINQQEKQRKYVEFVNDFVNEIERK